MEERKRNKPKNKDNKTILLEEFDLLEYKELIEKNPISIATVGNKNQPNLSVASDVKVLSKNKIIISNNEMVYTPYNIDTNNKVVLTSFNKKWIGLRITGTAKYFKEGRYLDMCNELYKTEKCTPKGAIVVLVKKVETIK